MRIVVLGCGPKALAIYAKMKGLEAAGLKVPEVVILERSAVAAHWQGGDCGFTDGKQPLGTPPEKDIGYPYKSEYKQLAPAIDSSLLQYSWAAFKIAHGSYADWMDRDRPAPNHEEWAQYQAWVATKLQLADADHYVSGSLMKIDKRDGRWILTYSSEDKPDDGPNEMACDALVITGPGAPKRVRNQASSDHSSIMDGRTFWTQPNMAQIRGWANQTKSIAVIGAGETTASVISALLNINNRPNWKIDVISRRGTLYSRGEGYHENRHFSDPRDWGTLTEKLRMELIERTDRGVLSVRAMRSITASSIVNCKHGTIISITVPSNITSIRVGGKVRVSLEGENSLEYDCVIVALGFNALSFGKYFKDNLALLDPLVSEKNRGLLPLILSDVVDGATPEEVDNRRKLFTDCASSISEDLSVRSLEPRLYLPMLAGLTQGPGFPNLSCLGLLSDRILRHFVQQLNSEETGR